MKIIKEGNIEKKVTCSYCNCEYEYDVKDICEEYQFFDKVCKFVCCPECGEKHYIREDIKLLREINLCTMSLN